MESPKRGRKTFSQTETIRIYDVLKQIAAGGVHGGRRIEDLDLQELTRVVEAEAKLGKPIPRQKVNALCREYGWKYKFSGRFARSVPHAVQEALADLGRRVTDLEDSATTPGGKDLATCLAELRQYATMLDARLVVLEKRAGLAAVRNGVAG